MNETENVTSGITHDAAVKAVDCYGIEKQMDIAVEECAELIHAIQKLKRYPSVPMVGHVLEECADVTIMVEQLVSTFDGEERKTFNHWLRSKSDRLLERIMLHEAGLNTGLPTEFAKWNAEKFDIPKKDFYLSAVGERCGAATRIDKDAFLKEYTAKPLSKEDSKLPFDRRKVPKPGGFA